jgi:DNA-directed RNA polymerase subunit RPC12/RpoP
MKAKTKTKTIRPPRARDHGVGKNFRCPCGYTMLIKSRDAHPERGERYERQTFVCPKCGSVVTREVFTPDAAKKAKGRK